MPNSPYPMDPFSFIVSPTDQLIRPTSDELNVHGPDSGIGSEASPRSCRPSPDLPQLPADEDIDDVLFGKKQNKREKVCVIQKYFTSIWTFISVFFFLWKIFVISFMHLLNTTGMKILWSIVLPLKHTWVSLGFLLALYTSQNLIKQQHSFSEFSSYFSICLF